MLRVVISDLHLGAGPAAGGAPNPLEDFDDDAALCDLLSHHCRAPFSGIDVELIGNGDIFNALSVAIDGRVPTTITEAIALRQMDAILTGHAEVTAALRGFAAAPRRRVVFAVGNHDPILLLPGVQALLRDRIGAGVVIRKTTHGAPGLHIEHGHQLEPVNRFDPEACWVCEADDGERRLDLTWGGYFIADFLVEMKRRIPDVDKIVPLGAYLKWALAHRPLDALRAAFAFARFYLKNRLGADARRRAVFTRTLEKLNAACLSCDYAEEAGRIAVERDARVVILGHTHHALAREVAEGRYLINTGTWNRALTFHDGSVREERVRTFARVDGEAGRMVASLLEWLPGREPREQAVVDAGEGLIRQASA